MLCLTVFTLFCLGSADGTVNLYQLSGKRKLQTFIHSAKLDQATTDAAAAEALAQRRERHLATVSEGMLVVASCWLVSCLSLAVL